MNVCIRQAARERLVQLGICRNGEGTPEMKAIDAFRLPLGSKSVSDQGVRIKEPREPPPVRKPFTTDPGLGIKELDGNSSLLQKGSIPFAECSSVFEKIIESRREIVLMEGGEQCSDIPSTISLKGLRFARMEASNTPFALKASRP